jgi:uncharacterized protein
MEIIVLFSGEVNSMIIDSHQHIFTSAEQQIAAMDEAAISKTILFSSMVHPENAQTFNDFTGEMSKLYKILSDGSAASAARVRAYADLSERVSTYPDRFIGFGGCPAGMNFSETAEWIELQILSRGFKGIGEITYPSGATSSIENIFRFVYESGKKLPLWIHTFNPLCGNDIKDIISLTLKYSGTPVVMGHSGGYHWMDLLSAAEHIQNMYIDCSAQFSVFPLKYFAEKMPERILFSSDAPYGDPLLGVKMIERIIKDDSVRNNILYKNIEKLLS